MDVRPLLADTLGTARSTHPPHLSCSRCSQSATSELFAKSTRKPAGGNGLPCPPPPPAGAAARAALRARPRARCRRGSAAAAGRAEWGWRGRGRGWRPCARWPKPDADAVVRGRGSQVAAGGPGWGRAHNVLKLAWPAATTRRRVQGTFTRKPSLQQGVLKDDETDP